MTRNDLGFAVVFAALAGLIAGFAWGVTDHQSAQAQLQFIDEHIELFPRDYPDLLVFRCGDDKTKLLIGYNPVTGEILEGEKALRDETSNPANRFLQSDLFSHYSASVVAGLGVIFGVTDEIKAWKAGGSSLGMIGMVIVPLVTIVPTTYIGYSLSDFFKLECSSKSTYITLKNKDIWDIQRLNAAKALFDQFQYCIDRNATLPDKSAVDRWRSYVTSVSVNAGVPKPTFGIISEPTFGIIPGESLRGSRDGAEITWGDEFYRRIYGTPVYQEAGVVVANSMFSNTDFGIMATIARNCLTLGSTQIEQLKMLYSRIPPDTTVRKVSNFAQHRDILINLNSLKD